MLQSDTIDQKADEQGDAESQHSLGWMYSEGDGVPKDDVEAAKWFRKAAEQGDANAQGMLGQMYYSGAGVPQDYAEAVKWWQKAAEQRHAEAQYNLGRMYYFGWGVPKDEVESYAWHLLVKANGSEKASKPVSNLEEELTTEQMEKGQARALELHRLIEQKSAK